MPTKKSPNDSQLRQREGLPTLISDHQTTISRPKLKIAAKLTIPLISMAHIQILTCQVLSEIKEADMQLGNVKEPDSKPMVCRVLNLETMEEGLLICNEIIKSSFLKVEGGYVNKFFQLKSGEIREGKRYRDIDIALMEEV